ncbi:extracellular solute-binding protein [Micromonospora sp. DH14]|uniref:ABC transporter substrate-binding protein n=1 Tax=Micromonospora sp. DH14 TaxID=3040120 RepID=UPI00244244B0|nr:extracellular solute-binding protein [Micromonospora sp. DH14]MDG9674177.1 extracellular solute-binding protein [Micromonospora sp. DH14]
MRYRARGLAAILVTSALTAGLLTGCGADDAGSGKKELRILANITPVLTKEYYEKLVQPWVATQDGVTVTIEVPSAENVQATLQQELASGDVPDIVASNLDPVVAPQLLGLPEESWVLDTPLAQQNRVDGKIWQVATGAQIQSLVFYNKAAFAAAGIDKMPTGLDDFTAALRKLKGAGYLPLQTAGEWVTGAQFAMLANPELLKSGNFYADRTKGSATFAGSAYQRYLDAYATWIAEGLVDRNALGLKYQDSIDAFTSGKAATYVIGNWIVPSIDEATKKFDVGVFPTPSLDGSPVGQLSGPAQPYSILQGSKNRQLALDLVKYLVSDKTAIATSLASEGNFRQGVAYEASPLNKSVAAILDSAPGLVLGTSGAGIPGGFGDELNKQVQALYVRSTPADAAAALDSWWKLNANQ